MDFAKGFAILSIVLMHYCTPYVEGVWSKIIMLGGTGVHLFFVISGFGLGLSLYRLGVLAFYRKRFTKVLLPYYLAIITIFTVNLFYPVYPSDSWYALGGHLFLYKMFDETIENSFGLHFWFISTIVQFYIIFPLLLMDKTSALQRFHTVINPATEVAESNAPGSGGLETWKIFKMKYLVSL
ncbi:MAG: acyltransferase, partial [Mariprofundus sp.]